MRIFIFSILNSPECLNPISLSRAVPISSPISRSFRLSTGLEKGSVRTYEHFEIDGDVGICDAPPMPRSARVQYAGAVYHVMCRGDRREAIFRSDADRLLMLETLFETCERTGFLLHSYVLMPNHYHLLLETPEPNLVAGMKWFQGTYTQRFNVRNRLSGHLFQGRYKALPVEADDPDYFRRVSDYIHLNPVRAMLLRGDRPRLSGYRWSSYPSFIGGKALNPGLIRERVFAALGLPDEDRGSRARYRFYMEKRTAEILQGQLSKEDEDDWREVRKGWYCGSDAFRDFLLDHIDRSVSGRRRDSYRSEGLLLHDERAASEHLRVACEAVGATLPEVRKRRQNDPLKQAVAWWVKRHTVVPDRWICDQLMMGNRVNVSRAVRAFRDPDDQVRRNLQKKMFKCTDPLFPEPLMSDPLFLTLSSFPVADTVTC